MTRRRMADLDNLAVLFHDTYGNHEILLPISYGAVAILAPHLLLIFGVLVSCVHATRPLLNTQAFHIAAAVALLRVIVQGTMMITVQAIISGIFIGFLLSVLVYYTHEGCRGVRGLWMGSDSE